MTDELRFRDFSSSPELIHFRIAPDDFRCYPEIPLDTMRDIVKAAQNAGASTMDRFDAMIEMLAGVIDPMDYDKFIARTKKPTKEAPNPHPIGFRQVSQLLPWLMEVYGLRPTQASSGSSDGSNDASTSSTEPASDEALTS